MLELYALFVFIISCYGFANIIVNSKLFQPLRFWLMYKTYHLDNSGKITSAVHRSNFVPAFLSKLVNCVMCVGFWAGVLFSLSVLSPCSLLPTILTFDPISNTIQNTVCLIFDGCLGSASAWITHLLMRHRTEGA